MLYCQEWIYIIWFDAQEWNQHFATSYSSKIQECNGFCPCVSVKSLGLRQKFQPTQFTLLHLALFEQHTNEVLVQHVTRTCFYDAYDCEMLKIQLTRISVYLFLQFVPFAQVEADENIFFFGNFYHFMYKIHMKWCSLRFTSNEWILSAFRLNLWNVTRRYIPVNHSDNVRKSMQLSSSLSSSYLRRFHHRRHRRRRQRHMKSIRNYIRIKFILHDNQQWK